MAQLPIVQAVEGVSLDASAFDIAAAQYLDHGATVLTLLQNGDGAEKFAKAMSAAAVQQQHRAATGAAQACVGDDKNIRNPVIVDVDALCQR